MFLDGLTDLSKFLSRPETKPLNAQEARQSMLVRDEYEEQFRQLFSILNARSQVLSWLKQVDPEPKCWHGRSNTKPKLFSAFLKERDVGRTLQKDAMVLAKQAGPGVWLSELLKAWHKLEQHRHLFALANSKLVVRTVMMYKRRAKFLTSIELFQEGFFGLMRAVERYELVKNTQFSTYAVWWIRHAVQRAVSDYDSQIRVPVHQTDLNNKVNRLRITSSNLGGNSSSDEDLIAQLDGSEQKHALMLKGYRNSQQHFISFDVPISSQWEELKLEDVLPANNTSAEEVLRVDDSKEHLQKFMGCLSQQERSIIGMRFGLLGEERTLQEIGNIMDLSRERIRQLQKRALEKMLRVAKKDPGIMDLVANG